MRRSDTARRLAVFGGVALTMTGCTTLGLWKPTPGPQPDRPPQSVQTATMEPTPAARPVAAATTHPDQPAMPRTFQLDDLVGLAVARNPRVAQATIAIDAAQGRYIQAGLYPNPDFAFRWDEIGDRTAIANLGIMSPQLTQTIVTAHKLTLAQAVAGREVNQVTLDMLAERFGVIGSVRASFYEAYALQQRFEILKELVQLAEQSVEQSRALLKAQRVARLDLVQLEVELERYRADARAVERELPATYQRLAAVTGDPRLPIGQLVGVFDTPPSYDLTVTREKVLAYHPEVRSARVGVEKAQAAIRLAVVQPIPDLTITGGYVRQFENRSHDGLFGISAPIPVWNRNQGNIQAAQAELGMAVQNVGRVENELTERLATAFRTYAAARERAERYRAEILPRADETFQLSFEAFKGGQFEYLRVLQAQRAVAQARLELNRSLGEAWQAAGVISGLLLEEAWPTSPPERTKEPALLPAPKSVQPERP